MYTLVFSMTARQSVVTVYIFLVREVKLDAPFLVKECVWSFYWEV